MNCVVLICGRVLQRRLFAARCPTFLSAPSCNHWLRFERDSHYRLLANSSTRSQDEMNVSKSNGQIDGAIRSFNSMRTSSVQSTKVECLRCKQMCNGFSATLFTQNHNITFVLTIAALKASCRMFLPSEIW